MSQSLCCPCCQLPFTEEQPAKKLLSCEHSLCRKCLGTEVLCPFDKKRLFVRKHGFDNFATDEEIMTRVRAKRSSPRSDSIKGAFSQSKPSKVIQRSFPDRTDYAENNAKDQIKVMSNAKTNKFSRMPSGIMSPKENYLQQQKNDVKNEVKNEVKASPPKIKIFGIDKGAKRGVKKETTEVAQNESTAETTEQENELQQCLLHSKPADLICQEEGVLICSSCALFGSHRGHTITSYYDTIDSLTNYAEQTLTQYEQIFQKDAQMESHLIDLLEVAVQNRKLEEAKSIQANCKKAIDSIKKLQKIALGAVDGVLAGRKTEVLKRIKHQDFETQKNQYFKDVKEMGIVMDQVFAHKNVVKGLKYLDKNDRRSIITEQGEYLRVHLNTFDKIIKENIQKQVTQWGYDWQANIQEAIFTSLIKFKDQQQKVIQQIKAKNIKKTNVNSKTNNSNDKSQKNKSQTPPITETQSDKSGTPDDQFLLQQESISVYKIGENEPSVQFQYSQSMKPQFPKNIKLEYSRNSKSEYPLSMQIQYGQSKHCQYPRMIQSLSPQIPLFEHPSVRSSFQANEYGDIPVDLTRSKDSRKSLQATFKSEQCSQRTPPSKNGQCEIKRNRQVQKTTQNEDNLSGLPSIPTPKRNSMTKTRSLSRNKSEEKKRKLELAPKYKDVYDQLMLNRLQVADFGGAELGDSGVLQLLQCLQKATRLKIIKLFENKLSDEVLKQLLLACTHVQTLNLGKNGLTEKALDIVQQVIYKGIGKLKHITFSLNKINARTVKERVRDIQLKSGVVISI